MENKQIHPEIVIKVFGSRYSSIWPLLFEGLLFLVPYLAIGALIAFSHDQEMHWWIRVPICFFWFGYAFVMIYNYRSAWQGVLAPPGKKPHITLTDKELVFRDYIESDGMEHSFSWEDLSATQQIARNPFRRGPDVKTLNVIRKNKQVVLRINYRYWDIPIPIKIFQDYLKKEFKLAILPNKNH